MDKYRNSKQLQSSPNEAFHFLGRETHPKQIWRDDNDPENPDARQRELGESPGEDDLSHAGVAEHEEAAEGDEGEGEVVDDGDGIPEDARDDAQGLAEGPTSVRMTKSWSWKLLFVLQPKASNNRMLVREHDFLLISHSNPGCLLWGC